MINLDMDGVIFNFSDAALRACNSELNPEDIKEWNFFEREGLTEDQFWEAINNQGADFWENLELYPWSHDLINLALELDPHFEIVTVPGRDVCSSMIGKIRSLEKNFGPDIARKIHFATHSKGKGDFVRKPGDILVDDRPDHIDKWQASGGYGIMLRQPWNQNDPRSVEISGVLDRLRAHAKMRRTTRYVDPDTGAEKEAKLCRPDLIPPGPAKYLATVYGYGASKYDDHNYRKGYPWSKSIAAMERHILEFKEGHDFDAESGLPHLSHVAWHAFALCEFMDTNRDKDDRYKGSK